MIDTLESIYASHFQSINGKRNAKCSTHYPFWKIHVLKWIYQWWNSWMRNRVRHMLHNMLICIIVCNMVFRSKIYSKKNLNGKIFTTLYNNSGIQTKISTLSYKCYHRIIIYKIYSRGYWGNSFILIQIESIKWFAYKFVKFELYKRMQLVAVHFRKYEDIVIIRFANFRICSIPGFENSRRMRMNFLLTYQ